MCSQPLGYIVFYLFFFLSKSLSTDDNVKEIRCLRFFWRNKQFYKRGFCVLSLTKGLCFGYFSLEPLKTRNNRVFGEKYTHLHTHAELLIRWEL